MAVSIMPALNFLRTAVEGNNSALDRLESKLDAELDGDFLGTINSISEARRRNHLARLENDVGYLHRFAKRYQDQIEERRHNIRHLFKSELSWLIRIPFDMVADIPVVRRRDIAPAFGSAVIKDSMRGLTCVTNVRMAAIARLICYQSFGYFNTPGTREIETALGEIRSQYGRHDMLALPRS
jgi:hypothetical protein